DTFYQAKNKEIRSLLNRGAAMETIAIRTNTPLSTVRAMSTMKSKDRDIRKFLDGEAYGGRTYTSLADIDRALSAETRPLVVKTNIKKIPWQSHVSDLDVKTMERLNREFLADSLMTSNSTVARNLGSYFQERETLFAL